MADTKTEFKLFSITEWKKEEQYLRDQHKSGWQFVSVSSIGLYHFKKCEPEDVIYQLDYNPESVTQKDEYIQTFRDCGWEYLQNYVGYSYFRKPASEMNGTVEEIFCDDASRLDMMKRVFRQRMTPLLCIFFLIIIPQLLVQSRINYPLNHFLLILFSALFVLYLVIFIVFAVQFCRYARSVRR